jgi:D-glycero-D-manno-heptose 1,7-bisphosphate phosphatase
MVARSTQPQKALFLDRDGVIIDYIPYLSKPEQVNIPRGAGIALKRWQDAGYQLIIFTNQSGIGRGYFTIEDVQAVHNRIFREYAQFGVTFKNVLICPHQPVDNCQCRKPSPYLLLEYAQKYHIDISQSFFIGDAPSDIECAIRAGCQPVLLLTGRGKNTLENLSQYHTYIPVFKTIIDTTKLIK